MIFSPRGDARSRPSTKAEVGDAWTTAFALLFWPKDTFAGGET